LGKKLAVASDLEGLSITGSMIFLETSHASLTIGTYAKPANLGSAVILVVTGNAPFILAPFVVGMKVFLL
jgi:hypothetical protein